MCIYIETLKKMIAKHSIAYDERLQQDPNKLPLNLLPTTDHQTANPNYLGQNNSKKKSNKLQLQI